jgi:two-component system, cell cycle sensor histidine kinase and response regulator CckA
MSTTQKLLSGFGLLTAVLVVILIAIILEVQTLEGEVDEMSRARDRSAATRELEINALDYALSVLDFVELGDSAHRAAARFAAQQVEQHRQTYLQLNGSERVPEYDAGFDSLWITLRTIGDAMLSQPDRRPPVVHLRDFQECRLQLEQLLDERVQHDAVRAYEVHRSEVLRRVSNAHTLAMGLLGFGLVMSVLTSFVVVRGIVKEERISRERGEELRVALLNIDDAVMTADRSGCIVLFNTMAEKLTGWTQEEAQGKHVADVCRLYNGDSLGRIGNPIADAIASGEQIRICSPLLLEARDGTKRSVESTTSPIRDAQGTVISAVTSFRDLTERNKLQAQLLHAHKMEAVGRLAGGIAHDFNNILGIILGHSMMLEKETTHADARLASIERITSAARRGTALVSQLLTFARKAEPVRGSVRINDIIQEIEILAKETFPKTITFSTLLEDHLPSIVADTTQVHQVLLNLCVNARDAMPHGGILSIATRSIQGHSIIGTRQTTRKPLAQSYAEIEVCDNGMGMDDATLQKIFEPFYTTKGIGRGTGLGLSLVFGIVESHNGFLTVESVLGKGSCFRIYFPIAGAPPPAPANGRRTLATVAGGSETILLIEDEEMLRDLARTALSTKGYDVLTASNGEEGVELFCRYKPRISLVLTDFGLPKANGEEVVKRIRAIEPTEKIIVASGFVDPVMRTRLYREGARHILQKPYMVDELLTVIREVLDAK